MEINCAACGQAFQPRSQTPRQCYYRDNQARAQQAWGQRNRDYWREYRANHKQYRERNRALQRKRNARRNGSAIAKMDASIQRPFLPSGIYRLSRVAADEIAKMDAWMVALTLLSGLSDAPAHDCKERT